MSLELKGLSLLIIRRAAEIKVVHVLSKKLGNNRQDIKNGGMF